MDQIMNQKLIFLDIDGTLTEPGKNVPPPSAVEAVRRAREKGHKVVLCSGRNYGMLYPVLQYGFDGLISSAGGYIEYGGEVVMAGINYDAKKKIHSCLIERSHFRSAKQIQT